MKRLIYILYYLKDTDWKKYRRFSSFACKDSGMSGIRLFFDAFYSVLKFNISFLDYFYFRFYNKLVVERDKWAGTGFMYEFQLKMNPQSERKVLADKIQFLEHFKPFYKRKYYTCKFLKENLNVAKEMLKNEKIVLKNSLGQIGKEVDIFNTKEKTVSDLLIFMEEKNYDLAEYYVYQHSDLMKLSSTGLNTVRIVTQVIEGRAEVIAARLRISVNSPVDNLAAGNIAAPVDIKTGVVTGSGVYSDITKKDAIFHPETNVAIEGFAIPFWKETLLMAKEAALYNHLNRSVGWDIAITESGPELIEGNHNWCKLLWQLPVKKGLKHELMIYLNNNG